jgi:hypothetical protein
VASDEILSLMQAVRRSGQTLAAGVLVLVVAVCQTSCGPPRQENRARQGVSEGVTSRDLERDERLGGHTLHRHVGLSDDELRARLRQEHQLAAASSYTDRVTAERIVGETLDRSRHRIAAWLARKGPRPNLVLDYRGSAGRPIGRSFSRGEHDGRPAFDAVVVLKWDRQDGYFVLTSYPEASK